VEVYSSVSQSPGPRLIKKNLKGRSLTKVESHWSTVLSIKFACKIGLQKWTFRDSETKFWTEFFCVKDQHEIMFAFEKQWKNTGALIRTLDVVDELREISPRSPKNFLRYFS
jgi:hypothetical protein